METAKTCTHCGLAFRGEPTVLQIHGEDKPFCCSGCAIVYELTGGGEAGGSVESWFLVLLGFSAILSGFIMTFSWVLYLNPDLPANIRNPLLYVLLALSTPVILGVGYPYLKTAVRELVRGRLSMSSLIAIGTVTAYVYSAYLTVHHAAHVYFDSATMVIVLVTAGRFLQARARARAAQAMRTFAIATPQQARRVRDTEEEIVPVDQVKPGDMIRVLPAEKIAVDGKIAEGRTTVDESLLTGESLPVPRGPGDFVFQGTINIDGAIAFEAIQVGEGTLQAQIERLLADAVGARIPLQAFVDRVSAFFVGLTVALAAGVLIYYSLHNRRVDGFLNALSVLVVACPCALGIATPIAAFIAMQRAAHEGVLIRVPEVLEKMARVDTVVFDKTGTLTEGRLSVEEVQVSSAAGVSADEVRRIAASVENSSEHHAGRAIVEEYRKQGADLLPIENFRNHPGEGIEADVSFESSSSSLPPVRVHLGTLPSLLQRGLQLPADLETYEAAREIETRVYVGWGAQVRAVIRLLDHLRKGAAETTRQCQQHRLEVHVLSGDRAEVTRRVAESLSIAKWAGERLPWQKVSYVEELEQSGHHVAMVGDGVNDAPALAKATVGFAHQVGTDLSKEAADVHILGGDLARVPWALALSRKTFSHIRQNLFWAFIYNLIAMGLAAAGYLKPIMAAIAMLLSSLMVTANSMRLGRLQGLTTAVPEPTGTEMRSSTGEGLAHPFTAYPARETPRADPASSA
jgi:heavy metal translocating P-type ATPase